MVRKKQRRPMSKLAKERLERDKGRHAKARARAKEGEEEEIPMQRGRPKAKQQLKLGSARSSLTMQVRRLKLLQSQRSLRKASQLS